MNDRLQKLIDEMMGNEALWEMLETDAAREMLNWGIAMATWLVERTRDAGDAAPELLLLPRLKAVRQTMRSVGNWAAGKYVEPADRVKLRERLLHNLKVIFGEEARLPSADDLDRTLNEVDDQSLTPHQLVSKLRTQLTSHMEGDSHA